MRMWYTPRAPIQPAARRSGALLHGLLLLALFLGVRVAVRPFRVEGRSMVPTLQPGQVLLVDTMAYRLGQPQRGDLVVLRLPAAPQVLLVKRVIALPGEQIAVHDGTVFVDGRPLPESYLLETPRYTGGPSTVPAGAYFVLGDNRNDSADSHEWGWLPRANLVGKVRGASWSRFPRSVPSVLPPAAHLLPSGDAGHAVQEGGAAPSSPPAEH